MKTTIGFVPIARPTFDVELAQEKTNAVYVALQENGFDVVGTTDLVMSAEGVENAAQTLLDTPLDLLLVLQSSFADSTMIIQLVEKLTDVPLLMWALPEERVGGRLRLNSFCGINLAAHGLKRRNYAYDYVYAEPSDKAAIAKVSALAKASAVRKRLQGARIGRVGENPEGFDTCLVNWDGLKNTFGLDVVQLELNQVFDGARQADAVRVTAAGDTLQTQVSGIDELDQTATKGTLGTYVSLQDIAKDQKLDGLAVRCWPEFFTDLGCSACGAMSMLSNELTPCSCEADVNGTITQLILQWIADEPAFGSDVVSFDTNADVSILWHCGLAPLHMANPSQKPGSTIHSNRKMPLLMEFTLKPGRVTIARLSEASGEYRLVVGSGTMIDAPPSFSGTTGSLRFDSGAQAVMDTIMEEGLEHHVSLVYGDHVESLLALAKMLGLPVLKL